MKTIFKQPASVERKWFIIDAENKVLGRVAARAASLVRGKEKAFYTPHQEVGDFVVIINAEKALLTGNKGSDKLYYSHSGYPGGLSVTSYDKLLAKKPTSPMEKALKGMLPKGPLGRKLFTNVKVYAGTEHPHKAQNPQAIEI